MEKRQPIIKINNQLRSHLRLWAIQYIQTCMFFGKLSTRRKPRQTLGTTCQRPSWPAGSNPWLFILWLFWPKSIQQAKSSSIMPKEAFITFWGTYRQVSHIGSISNPSLLLFHVWKSGVWALPSALCLQQEAILGCSAYSRDAWRCHERKWTLFSQWAYWLSDWLTF